MDMVKLARLEKIKVRTNRWKFWQNFAPPTQPNNSIRLQIDEEAPLSLTQAEKILYPNCCSYFLFMLANLFMYVMRRQKEEEEAMLWLFLLHIWWWWKGRKRGERCPLPMANVSKAPKGYKISATANVKVLVAGRGWTQKRDLLSTGIFALLRL